MASLNQVFLIGHLGDSPKVRHIQNAKSVTNFNLATNSQWKNDDGTVQTATEWHRIIVWGKPGENCAKYLKKGSMAFIQGKLQTRSYEKNGEKRFFTEIIATQVQFLSLGNSPQSKKDAGANCPQNISESENNHEDECPF